MHANDSNMENNVDACQWLQHGQMTDDDCAPLGCSSMSGIKFKLQWHQRASNFTCINFSFQVPSSCRGWNAGPMTPQSPVTHTIMWPSCEHHGTCMLSPHASNGFLWAFALGRAWKTTKANSKITLENHDLKWNHWNHDLRSEHDRSFPWRTEVVVTSSGPSKWQC